MEILGGIYYILLITLSTIYCQQNLDGNPSLIIETKSGRVRGTTQISNTGKQVDAWLGIPYAEKPLGDLRFRHPQPIKAWGRILNATQNPNSCVQMPNVGDEDCLYLSITVPKPRPTNSAVMVWIHGGGFYSGSNINSNFDYKTMASEGSVILVGINYRLASLGFLYFGTADAPGNVGLFDQNLALKWIHDNIASFGGDPNKITIFGQSAGSKSVSLHLLSPHSAGLFSKAILESGSSNAPLAMPTLEEIQQRGLYVANVVGCPHDGNNVKEVIDCLKNTSALDLVNNEPWDQMEICEFPFTPIIDGNFILEDPEILLDNKKFTNVSILAGSNSEEGLVFLKGFLPNIFQNENNLAVNRSQFLEAVDTLTSFYDNQTKNAIIFEYTDWSNPDDTNHNLDALDKLVGDSRYTCSTTKLAHMFSETGNDVYVYYFTHRTSTTSSSLWEGVVHGDEIAYVFGIPLNPSNNYTSDEIELSRRMVQYWTNFAKTGNPNTSPDGSVTEIEWPIHSSSGREYLELNVNSTRVGRGPREEQCVFWKNYIPQLNDFNRFSGSNGLRYNSKWSFLALAFSVICAIFVQ